MGAINLHSKEKQLLCTAYEHQMMHVLTQNDIRLSFRMAGPDEDPRHLSLPEIQTICFRISTPIVRNRC